MSSNKPLLQTCPLCGAQISQFFEMEEHQKNLSCSAMHTYRKFIEDGWEVLPSHLSQIASDVEAPTKTALVPERVFKTDHKFYSLYGLGNWQRSEQTRQQHVITCVFAPKWAATILKITYEQGNPDYKNRLGPRTMRFLEHVFTYEKNRDIYTSALMVGGLRRACELFENDTTT